MKMPSFSVLTAACFALALVVGCAQPESQTSTPAFTITVSAGAHGAVTPPGATKVTQGADQSYTITADAGYHVASVLVDGAEKGALSTYSFTKVSADHTLAATFAVNPPNTHLVTVSPGAHGTITVTSGTNPVPSGESVSYAITADAGYEVVGVEVDGAQVGARSSYTFSNLTSSHEISATFLPLVTGTNLFTNASAETVDSTDATLPLGWHHGSWSDGTTNQVTFDLLNTGHTGTHSVRTSITNYSVDGDAKWYPDYAVAQQDGFYEYSDWYKSDCESYVVAYFYTWDNATATEVDKFATIATLAPASDWTRVTAQFTVPKMPDGLSINVSVFHMIMSNGSVTTDDVSLIKYTPTSFDKARVSVSFDDGLASTYTNGAPVLAKYSLPATFYILSGNLDKTVDGIAYMKSSDVTALKAAGHEIGSHTIDHPSLIDLETPDIDRQLGDSQSALRTLLGDTAAVTGFASPYGNMDQRVKAEIPRYYASHRGVIAGFNSKDKFDRYNLVVQDITATTTLAQVQAWLQQASSTGTWLILVFHGVETGGGDYAITPAQLDEELKAVHDSGITVRTVQAGLDEVLPQLAP